MEACVGDVIVESWFAHFCAELSGRQGVSVIGAEGIAILPIFMVSLCLPLFQWSPHIVIHDPHPNLYQPISKNKNACACTNLQMLHPVKQLIFFLWPYDMH
jgi:hypothetical protein